MREKDRERRDRRQRVWMREEEIDRRQRVRERQRRERKRERLREKEVWFREREEVRERALYIETSLSYSTLNYLILYLFEHLLLYSHNCIGGLS